MQYKPRQSSFTNRIGCHTYLLCLAFFNLIRCEYVSVAIYTKLAVLFCPHILLQGCAHNLFKQFSIDRHLDSQSFAIKHWSIWNWFSIWGEVYESKFFFFSRWLYSLPFLDHLLKSSLRDCFVPMAYLFMLQLLVCFKFRDIKSCEG